MSLRDLLLVLRKRRLLIAALTVVCVAVAGYVAYSATPLYRASASVYFTLPYGNSAGDLSQGSIYAQSQMLTYAQTATTPVVLEPASKAVGGGATASSLAGAVSASASTSTVIIKITAHDPSPDRAARIANAVATQLEVAARDLSPKTSSGKPTVDAQTIEQAVAPRLPYSPKKTLDLALGLLGGVFLGVALAVLLETLNTRIRSRRDLEAVTDAPVLGEIQVDRKVAREHIVMRDDDRSVQAEAFRRLHTNLTFLSVDRKPLAAVVTSTLPREGKSSIAVNLAMSSAQAGMRTLLIDADLRSPSVASYMGLEGSAGLSNILIGQATFDEVVQPFGLDTNLEVLTSGPVPPIIGRLLASDTMKALLLEVLDRYDVILVDCAPLLAVTDAAVLARDLSGAVVVTQVSPVGQQWRRLRRPRVSRGQLAEALRSLEQLDAEVLGMIANGTPRKSEASYGYATSDSGWSRRRKTNPEDPWTIRNDEFPIAGLAGAFAPENEILHPTDVSR